MRYWICVLTIVVVVVCIVWAIGLCIIPIKLDVLVVSPGGGGTTYVMGQLKAHTNLRMNSISDRDRLKHISFTRISNIRRVAPKRILYLFNDPALAIESHFNRKWAQVQLDKLGNPYNLDYLDLKDGRQRFYTDCVDKGVDMYGIEQQFTVMTSGKLPCPVMCVDFAQFETVRTTVADFLGISSDQLQAIRTHKRNSSNVKMPTKYKEVYDSLYSRMKQFHGTVVQPRGNM